MKRTRTNSTPTFTVISHGSRVKNDGRWLKWIVKGILFYLLPILLLCCAILLSQMQPSMCVPWQIALKPITLFWECSDKLSQYRDLEEHLGARIPRLLSEGKGSGRRVWISCGYQPVHFPCVASKLLHFSSHLPPWSYTAFVDLIILYWLVALPPTALIGSVEQGMLWALEDDRHHNKTHSIQSRWPSMLWNVCEFHCKSARISFPKKMF